MTFLEELDVIIRKTETVGSVVSIWINRDGIYILTFGGEAVEGDSLKDVIIRARQDFC